MNFLVKIEELINKILTQIGEIFLRILAKLIHPKIKKIFSFLKEKIPYLKANFKKLPKLLLTFLLGWVQGLKGKLLAIDFKAKLKETYGHALKQYEATNPGAKAGKLKQALIAPFLIIGQWLAGLSPTQSLILLSFTAGSFLSAISIFSQGQKIAGYQVGSPSSRNPASEESVEYDRPDYYKKPKRHLEITNMRLPVYVPEVNELKSIDIDFTATLSNRNSRMILEKLEFQLRDFLIQQVEPMVASFPLEDEGKEIIRQKLLMEVNAFMKEREIEGEVLDLKLTYILAN